MSGILLSMTLDSLIMLCGVLVAILPFLGFPNSWDSVMFVILGVIMVSLGIVVRRRAPRRPQDARDSIYEESSRTDR